FLQIMAAKGKRLLIDEIDAGIHRFKFKDFWRILILAAEKNNVQIFATTHNLECVEHFSSLLGEDIMSKYSEESRTITLYMGKENKIFANVRTHEAFDKMISLDRNIM